MKEASAIPGLTNLLGSLMPSMPTTHPDALARPEEPVFFIGDESCAPEGGHPDLFRSFPESDSAR